MSGKFPNFIGYYTWCFQNEGLAPSSAQLSLGVAVCGTKPKSLLGFQAFQWGSMSWVCSEFFFFFPWREKGVRWEGGRFWKPIWKKIQFFLKLKHEITLAEKWRVYGGFPSSSVPSFELCNYILASHWLLHLPCPFLVMMQDMDFFFSFDNIYF